MIERTSAFSRRSALRLLATAALLAGTVDPATVGASYLAGRHYYGGWNYYPTRTYYYSYYYYKPQPTYEGYKYHYCVYYPTTPRYVYYYNPVARVYWGRYDLEAKGYSLLAEKDRKADLKAIPETAFPKAGEMPKIPDADDDEKMLAIDPAGLPKSEIPKDVPGR